MVKYDDTHIYGQLTFAQIAEAIRHKKYGRDMREAIAQGFELFIGILERVSDLESEYNNIIVRLDDDEKEIRDLQNENIALNQRCDKIEETHRKDIEIITKKHNEDIKTVQEQLDRLNQAVFGYGEFEINYQKPPKQRPDDYEINYRKPLSTGQPTHELNYSEIGDKHNFIEIETERDHKKEKGL